MHGRYLLVASWLKYRSQWGEQNWEAGLRRSWLTAGRLSYMPIVAMCHVDLLPDGAEQGPNRMAAAQPATMTMALFPAPLQIVGPA